MKAKTITKKKPTKTKLKKRADALFSEYIRKRDGYCLHCGKTENLQCSHIVGRLNHHLRYDPQNAITLCYACHIHFWHKEPLEASVWFRGIRPDAEEYLNRERNKIEKLDYEEIVSSLNGMLKELEGR